MRFRLRTLMIGQFGILSLFAITTLAAIVFGVICLPSLLPEKILALMALFLCLRCWKGRNYLHPLQASIPYAVRRRLAILDVIASTLIWPSVAIWLYVWRDYRSSHPLWFSDVVFGGSLLVLFGVATWKLVRALQPGTVWTNTIEAAP